jgi:nitronate monooxygenase
MIWYYYFLHVAGFQAAQLGTVFLTCKESSISSSHRKLLTSRHGQLIPTKLICAFSGKYARGLPTVFSETFDASGLEIPPYPIANAMSTLTRRAAVAKGEPELQSMWAGQGAGVRGDLLDDASEMLKLLDAELRQSIVETQTLL